MAKLPPQVVARNRLLTCPTVSVVFLLVVFLHQAQGSPFLSFLICDVLTFKPCYVRHKGSNNFFLPLTFQKGPFCVGSLFIAPLRMLVLPADLPPGCCEVYGARCCSGQVLKRVDNDCAASNCPWCALLQAANEIDLRIAAGQPVCQSKANITIVEAPGPVKMEGTELKNIEQR